jgi:hydroxymethylpyrimidine pyrophosphatase-like HAD family hydrolase
MPRLKALYVDLDNTLLGKHASILHDGDGKVSNLGFRAVEACHRADVELVIMSGRRRAQVMEDARLLGGRAYIFEAGAAVVDGPDVEWLTAPYMPGSDPAYPTVNALVERSGAPALLLERFAGRLEYHDPWHLNREVSHLFRGAIDVRDADALLQEHGHEELRLLDNGAIDREGMRGYHLVPRGVSKGAAVARHMRVRGYAPEECIAAGDSREDLTAAAAVGTFWLVANAVDKDPMVLADLPRNARLAEAGHGAGVYEAVVTELSERR